MLWLFARGAPARVCYRPPLLLLTLVLLPLVLRAFGGGPVVWCPRCRLLLSQACERLSFHLLFLLRQWASTPGTSAAEVFQEVPMRVGATVPGRRCECMSASVAGGVVCVSDCVPVRMAKHGWVWCTVGAPLDGADSANAAR